MGAACDVTHPSGIFTSEHECKERMQGDHRLVKEREGGEGRVYAGSVGNVLVSPER